MESKEDVHSSILQYIAGKLTVCYRRVRGMESKEDVHSSTLC